MKELKLHAVVSPTETVVVSAYDENGKAKACTLAFYMVSSHIPPCVTIAINATQRRKTLAAMLHSNAFVLGIPSIDQVKETDYLGVESSQTAANLWKAKGGTPRSPRRRTKLRNPRSMKASSSMISNSTKSQAATAPKHGTGWCSTTETSSAPCSHKPR